MPSTDTIVIGAGHAGLAMSRRLTERSIDHVVLERGRVANSWRTERWDSLRLLTPNWQARLPGLAYDGNDPDGFMSLPEVVTFIDAYADVVDAPVQEHTTVTSVTKDDDGGFVVTTDQGVWRCRAIVLATGAYNRPHRPRVGAELDGRIAAFTPSDYGNPSRVGDRVLVVGASATGVQIADDLARSGRDVTVSVGEHVRMPRVYRGMDIMWWLDAVGVLDEGPDEIDDLDRARTVPSPQLVGSSDRSTLDLNALVEHGVRTVGRLAGLAGDTLQFSGSLRNVCELADLKLGRLLDRIDEWATARGLDDEVEAAHRPESTRVDTSPTLGIDLAEFDSVLWATGFRPDYSWLDLPVVDRRGRLRHDGGVVEVPGLYVLGLPVLRRRRSSFIHGAADDTAELADHLVGFLDRQTAGR